MGDVCAHTEDGCNSSGCINDHMRSISMPSSMSRITMLRARSFSEVNWPSTNNASCLTSGGLSPRP